MAPFFDVAIPTHFYKIVAQRRPNGTLDMITILIPHRSSFPSNTNNYLSQRIRTIERLTRIDFFAGLPDQLEDAVESFKTSSLWATQ
jgi:endonuclease G, mitochondrial